MKHTDIDAAEDTLVTIASAASHIDFAVTLIQQGLFAQAILELRAANQELHRTKLLVMAVRWMHCPDTMQKLIQEQLDWLRRRLEL